MSSDDDLLASLNSSLMADILNDGLNDLTSLENQLKSLQTNPAPSNSRPNDQSRLASIGLNSVINSAAAANENNKLPPRTAPPSGGLVDSTSDAWSMSLSAFDALDFLSADKEKKSTTAAATVADSVIGDLGLDDEPEEYDVKEPMVKPSINLMFVEGGDLPPPQQVEQKTDHMKKQQQYQHAQVQQQQQAQQMQAQMMHNQQMLQQQMQRQPPMMVPGGPNGQMVPNETMQMMMTQQRMVQNMQARGMIPRPPMLGRGAPPMMQGRGGPPMGMPGRGGPPMGMMNRQMMGRGPPRGSGPPMGRGPPMGGRGLPMPADLANIPMAKVVAAPAGFRSSDKGMMLPPAIMKKREDKAQSKARSAAEAVRGGSGKVQEEKQMVIKDTGRGNIFANKDFPGLDGKVDETKSDAPLVEQKQQQQQQQQQQAAAKQQEKLERLNNVLFNNPNAGSVATAQLSSSLMPQRDVQYVINVMMRSLYMKVRRRVSEPFEHPQGQPLVIFDC